MACNIQYSKNDKAKLRVRVLKYLKLKNWDMFLSNLITGEIPKETRFTKETLDTEDSIQRTIKDLIDDLDFIVQEMSINNSSLIPDLKTLQSKVYDTLHITLDEALELSSDENASEIKDTQEVRDLNILNLEKHYKDIYGTLSYNIIKGIERSFKDSIIESAYCNLISGEVYPKNDEVLNKNILRIKNELFNKISLYLSQTTGESYPTSLFDNNGEFIKLRYYEVLLKFYLLIKSNKDFLSDINNVYKQRIDLTYKKEKEDAYKQLVFELSKNEVFNKKIASKRLSLKRLDLLKFKLYTADTYSEYYRLVKNILIKNPEIYNYKVGELINFIENNNNDLLTATEAYTMLTHFDLLLYEAVGDNIVLADKSLKNIELGTTNKYRFAQDSSHQRKSWQQSENFDSTLFISNLSEALLDLIRLYNYRTDTYLNKRLNSTMLVTASSNLLSDILYNNISDNKDFLELAYTLHNNPEHRFTTLLKYLFGSKQLINKLSNKRNLKDFDINVLYSLYHAIFNEENPNSLLSLETSSIKQGIDTTQSLLLEFSGFVDRNSSIQYLETSYNNETGLVIIKAKKKFFNDRNVFITANKINAYVSKKSLKRRLELDDKYLFEEIDTKTNLMLYSITLPHGFEIVLNTDNILFDKSRVKFITKFDDLNKINLMELLEKIKSNTVLTENETILLEIIKFVDDSLNLGILDNAELGLLLLLNFKEIDDNYLEDLIALSVRAAYVNKQYVNAGEESLVKYLEKSNDSLYNNYLRGGKKSSLFSSMFGDVKYVVASRHNNTLKLWEDAKSNMSEDASRANTRDHEGNSIPNNSVNKLGTLAHYYLNKLKNSASASNLLFIKNTRLIKNTFHELEVTNLNGESKSVKAFSAGELFFNAIFNKFWGNYIQTGNVIIQPTEYSDKTTLINYELSTLLDGEDLIKVPISKLVDLYMNTIGEMYKSVYDNSIIKLTLLLNYYNNKYRTNLTYKEIMRNLSEELLINEASEAGITLSLDLDYRIVNEVTTPNDLLEYYAKDLFVNKENLKEFLEKEKVRFIDNIFDTKTSFQVLDYGDDISNYLGDNLPEELVSKNPVIHIIKLLYNKSEDRKKFFTEWVDAKTGKLILAKLGDTNIISRMDSFNKNKNILLNPLLNRFFYLEGLYSNNFRMSLTGNELNHPDKAKDTMYNRAKKGDSKLWEELGITDTKAIQEIINNTITVGDLFNITHSNPEINTALKTIYRESNRIISNVALSTLFKRNVIIPATLQYCQLNLKNGIPPKTKVAVIRDLLAPVFNYKGDHEKDIDSQDGSAYISPFLSILENDCLGSLAVGFVKKPIWHSYDPDECTAFLAKFATTTITNEAMRTSLNSHTSLYKLFKKMTNLPWQGDVDLTQSLFGKFDSSLELNEWFTNVILNKQRLLYDDYLGNIKEIYELNKESYIDKIGNKRFVYYTLEGDYNKYQTSGNLKVYHVFDGEHITFTTLEEASNYLNSHENATTINSLFELYESLGGINCVDENGKGSEFVNRVVANYMNNIGSKKENTLNTKLINQETYDFPLKKYQIGYALNNTAVKNGAKNINPSSSWYDDTSLHYFEVDSDGLGMQMNADHDIINGELTEFSQVIAATSAYGYTQEYCEEIYESLAKAAFESSKEALLAVDKFLKLNFEEDEQKQALSDLYDSIGKIILVNQSIKNKENLLGIIMEAVTDVFYNSSNHKNDFNKIPFSDANVYSDFIATLASTINKLSIKRKHPGSGCVLVPSYNSIQYFEFEGRKLLALDILRLARDDYKLELINGLKSHLLYNSETDTIEDNSLSMLPFKEYERLADQYQIITSYQTKNKLGLILQFLAKKQAESPIVGKDWFMPTDIVDILSELGKYLGTRALDSLDDYYKFKDGLFDIELLYNITIKPDYKNKRIEIISSKGSTTIDYSTGLYIIEGQDLEIAKLVIPENSWYYIEDLVFTNDVIKPVNLYRINVTKPRNLRPSLIRWQNEDGKYVNIFDTPAVKNPYMGNKQDRKAIQDTLHELHEGRYMDENGIVHSIQNLENTAAELIMSNIYKETFNIGNESLDEILVKGKEYFKIREIKPPHYPNYDISFVNSNGKHTLITLNSKVTGAAILNDFDPNQLVTNEDDEIHVVKHNRRLFKVGIWKDVENIVYENGKFYKDGELLDNNRYRLKNPEDLTSIQERIDYVKRYTITDPISKNGKTIYKTNTLYQIADLNTFIGVLGSEKDGAKQRAKIISDIYNSDKFLLAQVNVLGFNQNKFNHVKSALGFLIRNTNVSYDVRKLLLSLLLNMNTDFTKETKALVRLQNRLAYKTMLSLFLDDVATKKYISFLDSLNFIASRIPAQTLQSFMTMKNIAWTENTNNMAYVSHFLFYLQGSDLDIDKAYIMGLSYDNNALYASWSNLFDYTSLKTLLESKKLPLPNNIKLENSIDGVNIDFYLNNIFQLGLELTEENRIKIIQNYAKILRIARKNKISYTGNELIIAKLQEHEDYRIPADIAEIAYKNVASANIYNVSHDIRNRDLAYTGITMKDLQKAANNSPKGNKAAQLNMLNPLTKYVMLDQALVGKLVIGIAANGEKIWFNAFFHWHKILMSGDKTAIDKLKFSQTFNRIKGRAKKDSLGNPLSPESKTITYLPDLNTRDLQIRSYLLSEFGADEMEVDEYVYVDLLISQLLSAATDNAKELILAKINAGTNFAKMYIYGIMMGFDINDLVAFMTSPVSDLIDSYSSPNMFLSIGDFGSANMAINIAQGTIGIKRFLHGTIKQIYEGPDGTEEMLVAKDKIVLSAINSIDGLKESIGRENDFTSLSEAMKVLLNYALEDLTVNLNDLVYINDTEINGYLNYCQQVLEDMRYTRKLYNSREEYLEDIKEFTKLFNLASEISTIASKYLGLNQGLPTDKLGLLKRLQGMNSLISSRESILQIKDTELFGESQTKDYSGNMLELKERLLGNNSTLINIEERLLAAHDMGIINNFDIVKYLTDEDYKKQAIDYYGLIMGTLNGLDMVENNPVYKNIMLQLRLLVVSELNLSAKSRLINKLVGDVSEEQLLGVIKYVDKKRIVDFIQTLPIINVNEDIEAFDSYFNNTTDSKIELTSMEGIATFKHWVEGEFLEKLRALYNDSKSELYLNPLIPQLDLITDTNGISLLATKVSLLNPEVTPAMKNAYSLILSGISMMENIDFDDNYTYADILLLYNLIINNNLYGDERLTTIFKVCTDPNNIINRYLRYTAEEDYQNDKVSHYDKLDFLINAAPMVSKYKERFCTEPYIKVYDEVLGYILKKLNENNQYEPYPLFPLPEGIEDASKKMKRWLNFYEYCPIEMPSMSRWMAIMNSFNFENDFDSYSSEELSNIIYNILTILENNSMSGNLYTYKDC